MIPKKEVDSLSSSSHLLYFSSTLDLFSSFCLSPSIIVFSLTTLFVFSPFSLISVLTFCPVCHRSEVVWCSHPLLQIELSYSDTLFSFLLTVTDNVSMLFQPIDPSIYDIFRLSFFSDDLLAMTDFEAYKTNRLSPFS